VKHNAATAAHGWWVASAFALLLTACSSERVASSVASRPSSVPPSISPGTEELPADIARSMGLTRDDLVVLDGPTDVVVRGRTTVTVDIETPRQHPTGTVDVALTGTCRTDLDGIATLDTPQSIPTDDGHAELTVAVDVPDGGSTCHITIDAWVPGMTFTGGTLSIEATRG
jgi:hypothetical protein